MKKAILTMLILLAALFCAAQSDTITNISVTQRTDGSGLVDVYFNLAGQGGAYDITLMEISFDAGSNYVPILPIYLSGDTAGIPPGNSLHIVWDGLASFPATYSAQAKLKMTVVENSSCPPILITESVTEITYYSATSGGNITAGGSSDVVDRGVVWSTTENPTIEEYEGITHDGEGIGEFVSYLNELSPLTLYYVRAYATNGVGTAYGDQQSFTTLFEPGLPTLITEAVTEITYYSATSGGNITDGGGSDVVERGIVWSTMENPTIEEYEGITYDGEGIGEFVSYLTELSPLTLYYVRAYATNDVGTAYGDQQSFTTLSEPVSPTLTTESVTEISSNSATSGGNITDGGGADVVDRGVVWSTTENPTIEEYEGITHNGEGIGEFISYLTDLLSETTYYVRAYATNSEGTGYGQQEQFITLAFLCGTSLIADIDGNVYNTVLIGDQCWMKENLATTHYNNGIAIDYPGADNTAWVNNTTGAYAWYDNDITWKDDYGALYNWYAVDNANGLCPAGWHVASRTEWDALRDYLGGADVAGGKLKSTRTYPDAHPRWSSPNTGATNESNWTGLPGGTRDYPNGNYGLLGMYDYTYTSTELDPDKAYISNLNRSTGVLVYNLGYKPSGFSVRCLKDE